MTRQTRARRTLGIVTAAVAAIGLVAAATAPAGAAPDGTPAPTPSGSVSASLAPTASATPSATPTTDPTPSPSPTSVPVATPAKPAASTADPWAVSPYMGWSSYSMQVYSGHPTWITAAQIIAQSDAMHGKLQKAGYDHINIDSGWTDAFDGNGRPVPSATLYPQGFQKVIDHVHANGQKVGIYMTPGVAPAVYAANLPIAGAPGCTTHDIAAQPVTTADYWGINDKIDFSKPCSQKYIDSIVDQFAKWGIDFVKFDSVTPGSGITDGSLDSRGDVAAWSTALKAHKIWFELSWALDPSQASYWRSKANGWRVEWDVECYCAGQSLTTWNNIARLFPDVATWWRNAGDGGWNDLDSLDIGNGRMDGLTRDERQTAMTLWAVSAAPLSTGNDLTQLDSYGVSLLTNPEVVAVDQAGTPARPVSTSTSQQVWYSLEPDGSYTVALFNLGQTEKDITANWSDIGLAGSATVRDLWARKDVGRSSTGFTASDVPIHGVRLLKVTPQSGATVAVNDDALRVGYGDTWTRNGGTEVAAASQSLGVTVTDTGTPAPLTSSGADITTTLDDTAPGIAYTGTWNTSTGRGFGDYGDGVHWTQRVGDSFSYGFQGTGVSWVTEIDSSEGDADVYIDGQLVKTVSATSDAAHPHVAQQTVFSTNDLASGQHTLKVVMKSGSFMLLDRLDVIQQGLLDPATVSFDTKAPAAATFSILRDPGELTAISHGGKALVKGTDYTVSGAKVTLAQKFLATLPVGSDQVTVSFRGDVLDDVHAARADGASVSYTFRGTGVDWITATGPDQGLVDIYIDGKRVKRVDTSSATRRTQQKVFGVSGLSDGKHTFMAVKASGDVMRTDVIRYTVR
ncbi:X2-like carbohydrate binding domain-containing protein [Lysinimonas soli]|uniref:Alpha-galactosidase n=1 Tax=Lysinimonas soli TaxID=1074233 RepID=A0ABW0NRW4_9MICO